MDRDWVLHVLDTISGFSCGENGITRLALSEEELNARGFVTGLMQDLGMKIRVDGIGNIIGRLEGTDPAAPPVIARMLASAFHEAMKTPMKTPRKFCTRSTRAAKW